MAHGTPRLAAGQDGNKALLRDNTDFCGTSQGPHSPDATPRQQSWQESECPRCQWGRYRHFSVGRTEKRGWRHMPTSHAAGAIQNRTRGRQGWENARQQRERLQDPAQRSPYNKSFVWPADGVLPMVLCFADCELCITPFLLCTLSSSQPLTTIVVVPHRPCRGNTVIFPPSQSRPLSTPTASRSP